MLKVVIADDERMICSLITQLLDWDALGFDIVGTAYTGIDAYQLITEHRPDVVISDIRMPGFDGLELIKRTKEAGIMSEFIMISGFKQFEYAQTAMKYGVKYYLLKPIEEDKLREIVIEIKEKIQDENQHIQYRKQLETEIKETRDKMKKRFLTSLLFEKSTVNNKEIADKNFVNQEYNTKFEDGVYQAIFVKLDVADASEESVYSFISEIEKEIDAGIDVCEEYITSTTHSGAIVLLNYKIEEELKVRKKIEELYERTKSYVEQFKDFSVVIGVGEKANSFYQVDDCLRTATDAIKYRIKIKDKGIIYYEQYDFEDYDIENIIPVKKQQDYISKIVAGDEDGAVECLQSTIREIRYAQKRYSPVLYFDTLITYVNVLTDYCKQYNYITEEYEERLQKWNAIVDNLNSEQKLFDVTENFIRKTILDIETEKREKDIKPIRIVKKYIEENYMQDVSLNQLAEVVDMNASYLSSVFKKETGMTYSDYLTQCRIQNASKLLVETNMSINEIASRSGYQDSRYFSKQFLKQVGLKPSEYRKLYS